MTINDFLDSLNAEERDELIRHAIARLLFHATVKSVLARKAPDPQYSPEEEESEEYRDLMNSNPELQVSNLGRLRRKNKAGSFVHCEPFIVGKKGYRQVVVADKKRKYVHQLVAEAFDLPKTQSDQCVVNHKNGNPGDNRLENLEWATQLENLASASENDLFGYGDNKREWSPSLKAALHRLYNAADELSAPPAGDM